MAEQGGEDGWAALSVTVGQALRDWRRAHPRATLDDITEAVEGELVRLRTRYVEDLAAGGATIEEAVWPVCAQCGGRLQRRGRKRRAVLIPHQGQPIRLERTYGVCASCHRGVFPPG